MCELSLVLRETRHSCFVEEHICGGIEHSEREIYIVHALLPRNIY
jgi:hypothetical protein